MRHRSLLMAITAGLVSTGCVGLREMVQERMSTSRAHCLATAAWHDCGEQMASSMGLAGDGFRLGFIAGYEDICNGGKGKVPVVPPADYWRGNVDGAGANAGAWFAGFREGAENARRCGHAQANLIPTSCTPEPEPSVQPAPRFKGKPRRGDPPVRATLPKPTSEQAESPPAAKQRDASPPRRPAAPPRTPAKEPVAPPMPKRTTDLAPPKPETIRPAPPVEVARPAPPMPEVVRPAQPVEVVRPAPPMPEIVRPAPPMPKSELPAFLPPSKKNSLPPLPNGSAPNGLAPLPGAKPAGGAAAPIDSHLRPTAASNPEDSWATPNDP